MSDTDDTDDLLLIPPDFFVIDSDPDRNTVEPYYNIVDSLIQKVSNLQDRLQSIESSSLNNSLDHWFEQPQSMQNNPSGFQRYNSIDDLYIPQSSQSTPQKPHTKFKLHSLPVTPNIDRFSPSKNTKANREFKSPSKAVLSPKQTKQAEHATDITPIKEDGGMLNEIDTFLSKVKTIQRINAVRNLEREFDDGDIKRNEANSKEMDKLFADFNRQRQEGGDIRKMEFKEPTVTKEKTWRQGDNQESVPDYGAGMRKALYKNKSKNDSKKLVKVNEQAFSNSWTSLDKSAFSDSSSDSTQITAYKKYNKTKNELLNSPLHTNALNVLHMHQQLLDEDAAKDKMRQAKLREVSSINDNLGLLSLADIWNSNSHLLHANPSQLLQKLQEEKLRRQHCEGLIYELQNRNLELQQKLSVAVKVDDTKNSTIHQFQQTLETMITQVENLNKEKKEWEQEKAKLKLKHSNELEEASQKLGYYEKEASKALNLAHSNQEKLGSLEKRCSDLQTELQTIEKKCRDIQDDYGKEIDRNKQLSEILSQKEIELSENKNVLNDARTEVAQSKRAVEICQAEFTSMKNECDKLKTDLKDERDHIMRLSEERRTLLNEAEGRKQQQVELTEELNNIKKQLESNKVDLRNYYQGQVEILVQNKLREFQQQLDQAEQTFKEEIKKREMSIARTAATHIQQISEKYSLEIKLIEKKHHEESKLYQIQLMQYKQQIDGLQSKLDHMQEKRHYIVKQLQKIMESQWNEALRIISSGKSPSFNDEAFSTIDQLNSLKTRSYNNVEEVLAQQQEQFNVGKKQKIDTHLPLQNEEATPSVSNNLEKGANNLPVETPVTSKTHGNKQYSENEIQKYINLLLNRPPGNPTQEDQKEAEKSTQENVTDRASWQQFVRPRRHR